MTHGGKRPRAARRWPAVLAIAVAGPLLIVDVSHAEPAEPDRTAVLGDVASAADESTARREARRTGKRVEIADLRAENREVYANPTGTTTVREHARPVRVRSGSGWADVDATLHPRSNGTVTPTATQVDLAFSGGGTAPMLRIGDPARGAIALTWPAALPTPTVDGDTATYLEVLPGVDMRIQADVSGYAQMLVVKNAEAARNPALTTLRYGVKTEGTSLRVDADGNLRVFDNWGELLFQGPTPQMWDSSGVEARQAKMGVELVGNELTVTPNQAMLADPKTVYPVYLDPYLSYASQKSGWAHVSKHFATTSYYNSTSVAKVGHYNDPSSSPTSDTYRSYFKMNLAPMAGKQINKATFATFETYSWSCNKREVQLWETGAISSTTTWNRQPAWTRKLSAATVAKGYNSSCPGGGVDFDATQAVKDAAANRAGFITLGLRAASETDKLGWKKFRNTPVLEIEYNSIPDVPRGLRINPSYACGADAAGAPGVATLTPTLTTTVTDADSAVQNVRASFELTRDGAPVWSYNAPYKQAASFSATVPSTAPLSDNAVYAWRSRADDTLATSDWSAWCFFKVDTTAPSVVPGVTSTAYPEADPNTPVLSGGVGRPGTFTFTANGIADVAAYRYDIDNPSPATTVAATGTGGDATVSVTPGPSLSPLRTLYVRSVDTAGNLGAVRAYSFYVKPTTGPVGNWPMNEGTGTTLGDTSGNNRPATIGSGVWAAGQLGTSTTADGGSVADQAVSFNGTTGNASTAGPVVRTDSSFSVSAWVKLNTTTANGTILSQAGANASGFQLYYSSFGGVWVFNRHATDTVNPVIVRATSPTPAQANRWTQLTGVYDMSAKELRLYVNGALAAATPFTDTPWNATGKLNIARLWYNTAFSENFPGTINDVRVYDRVIYPGEIAAAVNRPAATFGSWAMDEGTGVAVADDSGKGRGLTAAGGVTWSADRFATPAAALTTNGTTGHLQTAGPVIDTDRSFSVAAWTKLSSLPTGSATVVSQDGVTSSGFFLQYAASTRTWAVSMPGADATTPATVRVSATNPAVANVWTHLVAVYDSANRRVSLYVNGELAGSASFTTPWPSTGKLQVGRAKYNGAYADYLPGSVDDIQVFTGVLSQAEVDTLATS